jgi:serine/threonine protein kinase/N-acetylneuraminic acid mutarotase
MIGEQTLIGRQLGRYRLVALLQHDSFGRLFRAEDQFGADALAARVLTPDSASGTWFAERLLRELRPLTHLSHPALLSPREVGAQGELVYLIGPLPPKTTLASRLGRPLPPPEALALLRPLAGALDYLHGQRIVHRRVSPTTILLGADGTALLAEAGLAEALAEATLSSATPSAPGPEEAPYLAPEQSQPGSLDGRADLYALGAVLYEALTGQPPLARRAAEPIHPPRAVNPDLSPALEAVLLRALADSPYERFATGADLFAALDDALRDVAAPTPAPIPPTPSPTPPDPQPEPEPVAPAPPAATSPPPGAQPPAAERTTASPERPQPAPSATPRLSGVAPAPMRWRDPEPAVPVPPADPESALSRAARWWGELSDRARGALLLVLMLACVFGGYRAFKIVVPGSDLRQGRYDHSAVLLPDGQILLIGGTRGEDGYVESAELYDPVRRRSGSAPAPQQSHTDDATFLLADGRVVVVGAFSMERYDPRTRTWQTLAAPRKWRLYEAAAALPSGQILVAGGVLTDDFGKSSAHAELYDPATNTWREVAPMSYPRDSHTATALPDGRVLVTGGIDREAEKALDSAEIYDPATNTWRTTDTMEFPQGLHSAALLPDGRVMIAGGVAAPMQPRFGAQIYDPATDQWRMAGVLDDEHLNGTITPLADGRVVAIGGRTVNGEAIASIEIYAPSTSSWVRLTTLKTPRANHTATLLPDGRILVIGGLQYRDKPLSSVETFDLGTP